MAGSPLGALSSLPTTGRRAGTVYRPGTFTRHGAMASVLGPSRLWGPGTQPSGPQGAPHMF